MRTSASFKSGQNAKDIAMWTHASLITVGSSLRSAGSSFLTGIKAGYDQLTHENTDRERVSSVKFGRLHYQGSGGAEASYPVLLLAYECGFQIWSLQDSTVKELISRRDGRVRCVEPMPLPMHQDKRRCPLLHAWPLVAVVTGGSESGSQPVEGCVRLYSLQTHAYVHSISVPGKVLSIACSRRVLLVAMSTQIMAYDTSSLAVTYSAVTYPAPSLRLNGDSEASHTAVPLALGARWLAHASNQPVQSSSGVAVAQPIGGGNGRESVQQMASQAAWTTGRHIKNMGEAGFKILSTQMSWRGGGGGAPAGPASPGGPGPVDSDIAGTVIVRDIVSRAVIAHFRAHTSPLLLMRFDGSGGLLVTASVHGHSINVFHVGRCGGKDGPTAAAHLFHLSRGLTPALIQDVSFSCCGRWLCCSSARGTTHVFRLALPGKQESSPPHLAAASLSDAERQAFQPVKLQAAGRARAGGLLNGSIPGSAAASAAVNLYNGSAGSTLVASSFMPRQSAAKGSGSLYRGASIEEDLYVATDEGLLVRHTISVSQPQTVAASDTPASKGEHGAGLLVEAVEQWQVGRRLSWPEREEILADDAGRSGEEASSEQPQPWSAFAETNVPRATGAGPPLWADSQFHILEMQTSACPPSLYPGFRDESGGGLQGSVLQVEEVPTKRINLQGKAGLAPVIIEGAETAVVRGAHSRAL